MKARHRERWALAGLGGAAVLLFGLLPALDLTISGWFYAEAGRFPANESALVRAVYVAVPWAGRVIFGLALALLLVQALRRGALRRPLWRRAAAVALVMSLGLGVLVHAVLKEHWGRPRPRDTVVFQGAQPFTPVWEPSARCPRNCSFVSGHAATGFALIGVGLFGSRATRRRWWLVGTLSGAAIGLLRVAQGGHYASDIVFGLFFMWACSAGLRELWLHSALRRHGDTRRRRAAPALSKGAPGVSSEALPGPDPSPASG